MGAWGVGIFENDDAADWICELEDHQGDEFLLDTLSAANENNGYLEVTDASRALAAAEVVAYSLGKMHANLPFEVQEWIRKNDISSNSELPKLALRAVSRIKSNSELQELWDEAEEKVAWYQATTDLENRLGTRT